MSTSGSFKRRTPEGLRQSYELMSGANPEAIDEVIALREHLPFAHSITIFFILSRSQLREFSISHADHLKALEADLLRGGVLGLSLIDSVPQIESTGFSHDGLEPVCAACAERTRTWQLGIHAAAAAIIGLWALHIHWEHSEPSSAFGRWLQLFTECLLLIATAALFYVSSSVRSYAERSGVVLSLLLATELRTRREHEEVQAVELQMVEAQLDQKSSEYAELIELLTYRPPGENESRSETLSDSDIIPPDVKAIPDSIYGQPAFVFEHALGKMHFEWSAAIRAATRTRPVLRLHCTIMTARSHSRSSGYMRGVVEEVAATGAVAAEGVAPPDTRKVSWQPCHLLWRVWPRRVQAHRRRYLPSTGSHDRIDGERGFSFGVTEDWVPRCRQMRMPLRIRRGTRRSEGVLSESDGAASAAAVRCGHSSSRRAPAGGRARGIRFAEATASRRRSSCTSSEHWACSP